MKIEITDLDEEHLKDAPEWSVRPFSCRYCIYWEYPEDSVGPATERKEEMFSRKLAWLRRTLKDFGSCGKLLYIDGKGAGYAQYAPPWYLPNSAQYESGPPGCDAVLLSCLFIAHERLRRSGLGSRLLCSIIDELRAKGARAIETFARRGDPGNPSGPVELYLRNGFRVHNDDKEFPLMRLDL
ncbi:MAG: GNAT family N-acetyltransferase [Dehalococcoidia bacterium]